MKRERGVVFAPERDCLHVAGGATGGFFSGQRAEKGKKGNRIEIDCETFLVLRRSTAEEKEKGGEGGKDSL